MAEEKKGDEEPISMRAVQQPVQPIIIKEEKKTNNKKTNALLVAGMIILAGVVLFSEDIVNTFPSDEIENDVLPADVELYKFNDLVGNHTVNVELWLINLGDETAKDINVFIRVRNEHGIILFSENLSLTALVLRPDETCSGTYTVKLCYLQYIEAEIYNISTPCKEIYPHTSKIYHTIEISWSEGRESYEKETIL